MKMLLLAFVLVSACATAVPGIKVVTQPSVVAACEAVPTFVPLTCQANKTCEGCLKDMSEEASKMGANTLLLNSPVKDCSPKDLTATIYKCK